MKPKDQGTRWETRIVKDLKARGLHAWRLAEGGIDDAGDITLEDHETDYWIIEAKHRERLNIHKALQKAKHKAATADLPFIPYTAVVIWKKTNRTQQHPKPEGTIVAIDYQDWLDLMSRAH